MPAAVDLSRQAGMLASAQAGKLQDVGNDGRSARGPAQAGKPVGRLLRALWGFQVMWVSGVGVLRLLSIRRGP
jgi:hypothetical protein